jgi:hypothetical protein
MWLAGMFLAGAWASWSLIHWAIRDGSYDIENGFERRRDRPTSPCEAPVFCTPCGNAYSKP